MIMVKPSFVVLVNCICWTEADLEHKFEEKTRFQKVPPKILINKVAS